MSYTSDVALVLYKDDFEKLKLFQNIKNLFNQSDRTVKKDDCVLVLWNSFSWSEWDEGPRELLDNLDEDVEYDNYCLIRIGEELEDNETIGGFWDNPFDCRIERKIYYGDCEEKNLLDSVQLKMKNTSPNATHCANCKTELKNPVPGSPNLKYCPICEP